MININMPFSIKQIQGKVNKDIWWQLFMNFYSQEWQTVLMLRDLVGEEVI